MGVKSEQPSSGAPDLTSLISQLHPQAMSAAADAAAASMAMGYAPAVASGAGPAIPASAVAAYSAANNATPESAAVPAIPASAVPADLASGAAAGAAPTAAADTPMEEARQAEMVADNGTSGAEVPPDVAPEVHSLPASTLFAVCLVGHCAGNPSEQNDRPLDNRDAVSTKALWSGLGCCFLQKVCCLWL